MIIMSLRRISLSVQLLFGVQFSFNIVLWVVLTNLFDYIHKIMIFETSFILIPLFFHIKGSATGNYFLIVRAFGLTLAWLPFYHMLNDSGESVTSAFGHINEAIFSKSWYLCPVDLQRYVTLIMCMAQKPAYLEGFAHINFSRETFKKVDWLMELYLKLEYILIHHLHFVFIFRLWTLATRTIWFFVASINRSIPSCTFDLIV